MNETYKNLIKEELRCPVCGSLLSGNGQVLRCEDVGDNGCMFEQPKEEGETIKDGFGSEWSIYCHECGRPSMHVVRPGKVQCGLCEPKAE